MQAQGLFTPHIDNCTASESFIQMGPGSNLGFCIENDQRSGAYFEVARQTCVAAGKRLPESVEFKYACLNAPGGLNDMTGDYEWATNFPVPIYGESPSYHLIVGQIIGGSGCTYSGIAAIVNATGTHHSVPYRCVH